MELELGLALPNNTCWIKGFDLNVDIGHCRKKRRSEKAFVCEDANDGGNDGSNTSLESPYCLNKNMRVKVKMEGVAIGRKVDLSLLNSYQALNCALCQMFPSHLSDDTNSGGDVGMDGDKEGQKILQHHTYRLTYEDEEGDWLLVGDVPWETFIQSVKRLKILVN